MTVGRALMTTSIRSDANELLPIHLPSSNVPFNVSLGKELTGNLTLMTTATNYCRYISSDSALLHFQRLCGTAFLT